MQKPIPSLSSPNPSPASAASGTIVFLGPVPPYAILGSALQFRFIDVEKAPIKPLTARPLSAAKELDLYETVAFLQKCTKRETKKVMLHKVAKGLARKIDTRVFDAAYGHVYGLSRGRPPKAS